MQAVLDELKVAGVLDLGDDGTAGQVLAGGNLELLCMALAKQHVAYIGEGVRTQGLPQRRRQDSLGGRLGLQFDQTRGKVL